MVHVHLSTKKKLELTAHDLSSTPEGGESGVLFWQMKPRKKPKQYINALAWTGLILLRPSSGRIVFPKYVPDPRKQNHWPKIPTRVMWRPEYGSAAVLASETLKVPDPLPLLAVPQKYLTKLDLKGDALRERKDCGKPGVRCRRLVTTDGLKIVYMVEDHVRRVLSVFGKRIVFRLYERKGDGWWFVLGYKDGLRSIATAYTRDQLGR